MEHPETSKLKAIDNPVRSYVLRKGRITKAQHRALREYWAAFGIETTDRMLDLNTIFHREAPVVLEIGFGNGEVLATLAETNPDTDFIGIEVYPSGIGALLNKIKANTLTNIRIIRGDAKRVIPSCFADRCLSKIIILFPDPWPKKRHYKRRLIQADFVNTLANKLRPGGILHLATDWQNYAQAIHNTIIECGRYQKSDKAASRPTTAFERRGWKLGHRIYELQYIIRT